ncbi:efflux RND transporter permease subunit [Phaeocystidibacter luteus]|uniref:Efflux RND transporter permease subunit n=1 Tax=Phaeocystidibacter luteus TaxID=911197 RepID=A0A6N6RM59_9FLAO|nr:efflux RND transporter permease subunit [Phaeocystidibacter luteus]KAB2814667.1 efflux RND transporter permease subunit [Phaeocystidibacter luteus]
MSEKKKHHFFVQRPIMAMVIAIVMTVVGAVSILGLPIEQYPNITPPIVQVRANYTGANAVSIEQSVAAPVEEQVNGVDNMIYMKSVNSNDGTMALDVSFDIGTDPDMNTVFVQNRVSSATAKLPEEVKRLGVTTQKSMPNILMLIGLTSSDASMDQNFLGNYALINIKDELSRIRGIGRVDVLGASNYSMRIWVRPDKLAALGITIQEIQSAIRAQNVIVPGGKFGAEPAPPGTEFTYTVRLPDRLQTEEEFGEIVVRTNADGSQVKLKHISRIALEVESYNAVSRLNGDACAAIAVYQAPGTNAVELAEKVTEAMNRMSASFPPGVSHTIALDSTAPITAGIQEIIITLIVALILVVLVVYLFIQDARATLIPTLAIPVSLMAAFAFFPLLGFSINTLSLLGLVLAIGIVVDDAIVVVEAVQVNMGKGMDPKEATSQAMKEVTVPVIATTLVLVAVFLPVSFIAGITGQLYQQFAITVAVSTVFSSINALSLSPALCSIILKKPEEPKGLLAPFFRGFNNWFDKSTDGYTSIASAFTKKFKRSLLYTGVVLVAAVILGGQIPGGFIPEEDQGYIFVNLQLPMASSLQRTDATMAEIEDVLAEIPAVEHVTAVSGFSMLSGTMAPNSGFVFVKLKDWGDRPVTALRLSRGLNGKLFFAIDDGQGYAFGPPPIPGLGNGSGYSIMLQDRSGNTPEYLGANVNNFIKAAIARPEIESAVSMYQASVPQKKITIDRDKVLQAGVRLEDVQNTFAAFLGGAYVNDFNRFGRLYRTYVQAEAEYRQNADGLNLFFVKNATGEDVPLSALVKVGEVYGPDYTNRFNLFRSAEVTGQPAEGYSSAQAMDALMEVADEVLPPDMSTSWNGMSYQEAKAAGSTAVIFAFSLFFVFLILSAQYESWSMPLSILMGTPFAIMGAMLFLYLGRLITGAYDFNVFAQISLVMLIAMAAKNAILIIEFAKIKFDEGLSLIEAAIEAARLRFRPILMTAASFILGILPLVIASGAGAEARKVMGLALLGGMVLATALGVLFYPAFFVLIGKAFKYEQKRDQQKAKEA